MPLTPRPSPLLFPKRLPIPILSSDLPCWLNGKDINGDGAADSSSDFLAGGKTSSWADRSGNSNTLTQGTSANLTRSRITTGGLAFDGNDFLSLATLPSSLAGNSGLTLLVVAESNCFHIPQPAQPGCPLRQCGQSIPDHCLVPSSTRMIPPRSLRTEITT